VFEKRAQTLLEAFARFWKSDRSFVVLKAGLSADGRLAPDANSREAGKTHWITGEAVRRDVHLLRHNSDAILVGRGTITADDPLLTDRSNLPRCRPLLRVVLDRQLRLSIESRIVSTARGDLLIFCGESVTAPTMNRFKEMSAQIEQVNDRNGKLDLDVVLSKLAERQIIRVLVEGGSEVNFSFLEQKLVDKVVLYYAPGTLGPSGVPFAGSISPFTLEKDLMSRTRKNLIHGDFVDIRVTGYLQDPWRDAL
jgi:diaminohydroxyphosphoribosylaminopyrimidine deaminase / 5-amino-6-(5-phosphoribosylamino)uracil reductase